MIGERGDMSKLTKQKPYEIKFTPLAEAVANRHGGVKALEEQIPRKELLPPWGPSYIGKLSFHIVAFGGPHFDEGVPKFICKPSRDVSDALVVDASAGAIDSGETVGGDGPLKGKKIMYVPEAFEQQKSGDDR